MIRIILTIFFLFSFLIPAQADIIYTKDGGSIEAEIIGENSVAITFRADGKLQKLYRGQVQRIERTAKGVADGSQIKNVGNISPEKMQLILRFIDATGMRSQLEDSVDQIMATTPAAQKVEVSNMFDVDEIIEQVVPIYDQYLSLDELKEIVAFHETAAAMKLKAVMPDMMKDVMQAALKHFQTKIKDAQ